MAKQYQFDRSSCPVSVTLDMLGDKWTLLVIRDLFLGAARYGDFLNSPERIPTNTLADRLKKLETNGLVRKSAYQQNPVRYEYHLTRKGAALGPVLKDIVKWASDFVPGTVARGEKLTFKR